MEAAARRRGRRRRGRECDVVEDDDGDDVEDDDEDDVRDALEGLDAGVRDVVLGKEERVRRERTSAEREKLIGDATRFDTLSEPKSHTRICRNERLHSSPSMTSRR